MIFERETLRRSLAISRAQVLKDAHKNKEDWWAVLEAEEGVSRKQVLNRMKDTEADDRSLQGLKMRVVE